MVAGCIHHASVLVCLALPVNPMPSNDPGCAASQAVMVQATNYATENGEKHPDITTEFFKIADKQMGTACGDE